MMAKWPRPTWWMWKFWPAVVFLWAACSRRTGVAEGVSISVMALREDNPMPPGSLLLRLQAYPADPNVGALAGFIITSTTFTQGQSLILFNATANYCNGPALSANSSVPTNGEVCFWADISAASEFESVFTYAAVDGSANVGSPQTVTVVNYNAKGCPAVAGNSDMAVPATPQVKITLDGLQVRFEVTAVYLRGRTWFIDFFDFNETAADRADGTGRTCSNHAPPSTPFYDWWFSQPWANFTNAMQPSIENALDNPTFPSYDATGTTWNISSVGCDKVKYTAILPTVRLIFNGVSGCRRDGTTLPAAVAANGLDYTASLYVVALQPADVMDSSAGYYRSTYIYPFSFQLQQTVDSVQITSSFRVYTCEESTCQ